MRNETCDIFCNVIDNYGDIGVCWRLARQLANEHGLKVRLWVDDLKSLAMLCPEADATAVKQHCRGVEVHQWRKDFPEVEPAGLVIEAFACKLPDRYIEAMVAQAHHPAWINLEYLSAEDWVEGCHKLPSPHPRLPLTTYFFFPGFTRKTGGLLLERDLLKRRDTFQHDAGQQQAFWKGIGMDMPNPETLKISLFSYENPGLHGLFDTWTKGSQPILCLVPEGRILPQVRQYFGDALDSPLPQAGEGVGERVNYTRGNLKVHVLPFVEQERYDELLWACDVNFVRGEDSCVRAQWAGRPFIWQIYPQHDAVHWNKLQAFLNLYGTQLSPHASEAVHGLWQAWNEGNGAGQAASTSSGQAWPAFAAVNQELDRHTRQWAQQLAENNLALNLLDFSQEIGRMRALKNEG